MCLDHIGKSSCGEGNPGPGLDFRVIEAHASQEDPVEGSRREMLGEPGGQGHLGYVK